MDIRLLGVLASLMTGLFTGFGGILIYVSRFVSKKMMNASLGAAAGIMLAATSFSLIIPAIEKGGGGAAGSAIALAGILFGSIFLDLADRLFPDPNLMKNSLGDDIEIRNGARMRKIWLFVLAITVHNFPEGLAVGVGFGDGDIRNGISLAIGIGMQNFPEGLAVALPLAREGYARWKALLIALATGLVEPIGGLFGVMAVQLARPLLPFFMAFAAG
ncbi:MAG TPA: ZIP family metal transporter, partial [Clostridiales bacterium]|nr:ZIP family metal transporter [Clostridiales bacterium]